MTHLSTHRLALRSYGVAAAAATIALTLSACGGGGFDDDAASGGATGDERGLTSSDSPITVLIGSSGDAETAAVNEAVAKWSAETGKEATVSVASDLNQQLSQGFAAGTPADIFYLSTEALPGFAGNGSVIAYGDLLSNKDDFYQPLIENFTFDGKFYCAPKDFSTLALIVNNQMWDEAGLGEYPGSWDELQEAAKSLTKEGVAGLAFGAEYQRVGVFMAGAGGALVANGEAVVDSEENLDALDYVLDGLNGGEFAFAADTGSGWGGEAFGMERAAMVIEGNWITGAMQNDYPDVDYTVVQVPAGPKGPGTLQFTNCWGMAADSPNQQAALELIEYLTTPEQQMAFSEAFGPMPSVKSAGDQWRADNPELVAFLDGADYAQFIPPVEGIGTVIGDFNNQLENLRSTGAESILSSTQTSLQAILG